MTSGISDLFRRARQLTRSGQLDEAQASCSRILELEPDNPEAHFELGLIALRRRRNQEAIESLSRAAELEPSQPRFHAMLGIAYSTSGNLAEGARCFQRALELEPSDQHTHDNLGRNYTAQGRLVDAERCFRTAISINPDFFQAHSNLGDLLNSRGELEAAVAAYRRALKINADLPGVRFNLAKTLFFVDEYEEAMALFERVAVVSPEYPGVDNMLGLTAMRLGKFDEAEASFKTAMERQPRSSAPHVNLGNALAHQGDAAGALSSFRNALAIKPDHAAVHSNLLMIMNYLPDISQEDLYRESLQFEHQHASGLQQICEPFGNSRHKDKVLRIGYLSPDFRAHSVVHFIWQLLGVHNRDAVEVFCYSDVVNQDTITERIKTQPDHWLSIVGMKDEDVAARIRKDKIDILVDLAGHTADNRQLVFARKPAPIQVNWLGYPNTTGLRSMDYRLTDSVADPEGEADRLYAEKLVRLKHGFLCYQTDELIPEVSRSPCLDQGYVTFGSFNHLPKITPDVLRSWASILERVPGSRLVMKAGALSDANTREKYIRIFLAHGISRDRLDLLGKVPSRIDHLSTYSRIDIGLDPFPYNGATTTFEALLMGVPVVCLRGGRHAGRVGASIMWHIGCPQFVANSEDDYINIAQSLAENPRKLATLRDELGPRMRDSELMNVPLFTETLENTYRKMWETWCNAMRQADR